MNIKDFTAEQQHALLDLVTLAMYADGHLAGGEDERIRRLLAKLGATTDYDRNFSYDAAVARVRPYCESAESASSHAAELARAFTMPEERKIVRQLLDDLVSSDNQVSAEEHSLLAAVKVALGAP